MSTYYNNNKNTFDPYKTVVPGYVQEFLFFEMEMLNRTPRTAYNHFMSLQLFLRWLEERNPDHESPIDLTAVPFSRIEKVTSQDITDFLTYCKIERKNGPASIHNKLAAIKAFFGYCYGTKLIGQDPSATVPFPARKSKEPKYLNDLEKIRLMNAANYGEEPDRNLCITKLFLNCGMRLSELTAMDITDVHIKTITVGQGSRRRDLELDESTKESLNKWMEVRKEYLLRDWKALFVSSRNGRRMTGRGVEKMLAKVFARAGLEYSGYSPSKLRHTAGADMGQKKNADPEIIKKKLGDKTTKFVKSYIPNED